MRGDEADICIDEAINRRALATRASLSFSERDYTSAQDAYTQYLRRYPGTTWSWLAALRLGQSHEALDESTDAIRAYANAATTYAAEPFARVLAHASAARIWKRLDRFDRALVEQQQALAGWDPDYGRTAYGLYEFHPRRAGDDSTGTATGVTRQTLADDTERLKRSLQRPGGALVERARWLVEHGSFREAMEPLSNLLARRNPRDVASEARYWEHRARVGMALELAATQNPRRNPQEALAQLDAIGEEPYDFGVFMARMAKASILWQLSSTVEADAGMLAAIERFSASQREGRVQTATPLTRDLASIRDLIVQPREGGLLGGFLRDAAVRQQRMHPLIVVNPEVHVRFVGGTESRIAVYQPLSPGTHLVFLTDEHRTGLNTIVSTLDGRQNQSSIDSRGRAGGVGEQHPAARALWERFFPSTEWRQIPGQTAPTLIDVEFLDKERTRAAARVYAASHGATVMLRSVAGSWSVIEIVDSWIS